MQIDEFIRTLVGAGAARKGGGDACVAHVPLHPIPSVILRWLVFDWLTYALLFLSLIALFEHLLLLSPSFPFSLVHVVAFAFMGLFALLQALAGFFSPRVRSRENRLTLTFGVYAVMSLLIVLVQHATLSAGRNTLSAGTASLTRWNAAGALRGSYLRLGNESDLVNVFAL